MNPLYYTFRPIPKQDKAGKPYKPTGIVAVLQELHNSDPEEADVVLTQIFNSNIESGLPVDKNLDLSCRLLKIVIEHRRLHFHIVQQLLESIGAEELDNTLAGWWNFRYAVYYSTMQKYDEAIVHFLQAIEHFKHEGLHLEVAICNTEMATLLNKSGAVAEALEMYLEQRAIIEQEAFPPLVAIIRVNIATQLQLLGNVDGALDMYNEALKGEHLSKKNRLRSVTLQSVAIVAKTKKDWTTAFNAYKEGIECLGDEDFWDIRTRLLCGIADLHCTVGNLSDAKSVINSIPTGILESLPANVRFLYYSLLYKINLESNSFDVADDYFRTCIKTSIDYGLREERTHLLRERLAEQSSRDSPSVLLAYYADLLKLTDEQATDARNAVSRSTSIRISLQKSLFDIERRTEMEKLNVSIAAREQAISEVAYALHDGVGQTITTLALQTDMLRVNGMDALPELSNGIRGLADEVRMLAHTLSPSVLKHFGIQGALNKLVNSINSAKSLYIDFIVHGDTTEMPGDVALTMYRSAQSLVQNSLRHASPSNMELQLVVHEGEYELVVVDDGKGFDMDDFKPGIGLQDIINRVALHEGKVTLDSQPGSGTTVFINIPKESAA